MKNLIVLLLMTVAASFGQSSGTVVYVSPCLVSDSFDANHKADADYIAAVTAMSADKRQQSADFALDCVYDPKATRIQMRRASSLIHAINNQNALEEERAAELVVGLDAALKSERLHREQSESALNAAVDVRQYRQAAPEPYRTESQPSTFTPTYVPAYTPEYLPPPEQPTHCVATSTPLGQSVVTGINCY